MNKEYINTTIDNIIKNLEEARKLMIEKKFADYEIENYIDNVVDEYFYNEKKSKE